jgi:hypothetical protein
MPKEALQSAVTSHWFDRYARFGYAAKGASWGVLGLIVLRLAVGETGEQADFYGALAEIDDQPLNTMLLVILAVGLLGYAGWRVVQGGLDVEGEGKDAVGLMKRVSYIGVGLWYGVFGVYTVGILAGWSTDGEEEELRDWTAEVLAWPAGEWLVGAAGAVVIATGLVELYYAFTAKFEIEIGDTDRGWFERACVLCTGWYGHAARGVVYSAAGFFAVRAAVEFDPDEARGLAETFRELLSQPHGGWIVGFIGAGFVAFGAYCVLLAFHRHIPNESIFRGRDGEGGKEGSAEPRSQEPDAGPDASSDGSAESRERRRGGDDGGRSAAD